MKRSKKSEMLEVRLSHEDKQALQTKATEEGRTVSFVIRRLISEYLTQPAARSQPQQFTELFMALKSKPKSVFASLACLPLLGTPFLLPTTANAGDIALTLESEYTEPETSIAADGKRVRRAKTEVHISEGQFFSLPFAAIPSYDPNATLYMSFRATEGNNQIVTIEISICEKMDSSKNAVVVAQILTIDSCDGEKLLANPKISAKYGETAEFRMETEVPMNETTNGQPLHEMINGIPAGFRFNDDSRRVFKLKASPKKL